VAADRLIVDGDNLVGAGDLGVSIVKFERGILRADGALAEGICGRARGLLSNAQGVSGIRTPKPPGRLGGH
jgi:hypothetical protein